MSHHLNATMAVGCAGAGCYAFHRKRSLPSLIASMAFASAYGVSTYLIQSNKNPQLGHDIGTVTSGLLALTMGGRVLKTKAWRQPGNIPTLLTISGTLAGAYNARKSIEYRAPEELDTDVETVAVAQ